MCFWAVVMCEGSYFAENYWGFGQWMRSLPEAWSLFAFGFYFLVYVGLCFALAFCPVIYWENRISIKQIKGGE
ncbi:MAG: hypothetical protein UV53_C0002G0032 [Candidatus Azambacteria bacterium GW2011_GWE1_42_9]|nr:MAG: hypothetical protein UV53_C0002G0032 [Candidatus Azambacteria bacterium GW2011_GWE1_42_9]KKT03273.1 MAG: hypothetical protein UV81_C0002G0026 [Candidatus Azambacteria bacterium GW2011_GWD1_43_18]KKT12650.1 MAG: hypothetical protein UV93_C0002G0048 [Candidatus Azambacteria bacterium GW2011_GWC2_43_27]KKT17163.1 MAG: hypothetical protein UV99_C0001G0099 [Parcubacteria group bacterium GW2011_GWC1_43_61]